MTNFLPYLAFFFLYCKTMRLVRASAHFKATAGSSFMPCCDKTHLNSLAQVLGVCENLAEEKQILCSPETAAFCTHTVLKLTDVGVMSNYNNRALSQDTSCQVSVLMRSICWLVPSAGACLHPTVTNTASLYTVNKETPPKFD